MFKVKDMIIAKKDVKSKRYIILLRVLSLINCAAMGRARFLFYPCFIFFGHVCRLNQTSLGQNSNDASYDVQGQQKSQITKLTLSKKKSIQNPDFEAMYHFSINSYLILAVVKSIS